MASKMFGRTQIFLEKTKSKNKSFFLYSCDPTHWRQNWRNIRGFAIKFQGVSLMVCKWWK